MERVHPVRASLLIKGVVQGVGFRPFIYNLALEYNLKGFVLNRGDGVELVVEGERGMVESFIKDIWERSPPLSSIEGMDVRFTTPSPPLFTGFAIRESEGGGEKVVFIPPDISVCNECLSELFDPSDRRYLYPFINCVNCGPRYTLVKDIPYDRPKTTMECFPLCRECREEYHNPISRRFHAQPNACPYCGPHLSLHSSEGRCNSSSPLLDAIEALGKGKILAIKGTGGFHLACNAADGEAVRRLREAKLREEKPFALMVPGLETLRNFAESGRVEEALLESRERPILLLRKRGDISAYICEEVAPSNLYLGVMLPYTPLHYLLFFHPDSGERGKRGAPWFDALVMTSGNLKEEPIAKGNREAIERLSGIADLFLINDRDIHMRCDDSVVRERGGRFYFLRRARGFCPGSILLPLVDQPPTLGAGGELRNTLCLSAGGRAYLSQHIGDMENYEAFTFFEEVYGHLKKLTGVKPEIAAADLHPLYATRRWAEERFGGGGDNIPLYLVQHHHAHIASLMAEGSIKGPVIGIALDGTGYGTDGTIWGGEVLLVEGARFERVSHLGLTPLLGGDAAVREPSRMAFSYLYAALGDEVLDLPLPLLKVLDERRLKAFVRMFETGLNSPLTSSCGRLFDGVSALLGIRGRNTYEGQAAMELEMAVREGVEDAYRVEGEIRKGVLVFPPSQIIRSILDDILKGVDRGVISARFHTGVAEIFARGAGHAARLSGTKRVLLSGGCFQNLFLLKRMERLLCQRGFTVHTHSLVPPNDGGISLGQVYVAGLMAREGKGGE